MFGIHLILIYSSVTHSHHYGMPHLGLEVVRLAAQVHHLIRDQLGMRQMGKIDAPLPGALPPTVWIRVGDAPLLVLLGLLMLATLRPRRNRQ